MDYAPEYSLGETVEDLREVASVLQLFSDEMPDEPDLDRYIVDLLTLADALERIDSEFPDHARRSRRLGEDVDLLVASISFTLARLRDMFQDTRPRAYRAPATRPYRRAWEDFCHSLREQEGATLRSRINTYSSFITNILDNLRMRRVDPLEIQDNRDRISGLLERQEIADQASDTSPIDTIPPDFNPNFAPAVTQPPNFPPHAAFPAGNGHAWWDEWGQRYYPTTAENPPPAYGPSSANTSPTSYSSGFTWSSNSSAAAPPTTGHWSSVVFTGRHPSTRFRAIGPHSQIYGRPDTGLLDRLRSERFYEVSRLTFEEDNITARFWWRPSDHRARLLLNTTDQYDQRVSFCLPLTALKLIRRGPKLQLWRLNRTAQPMPELELWATLTFTVYERLVLFYGVFSGMKSQDWHKTATKLANQFHSDRREEETELFGGRIEDGGFLHALRVYHDRDSGGIRLEARACRGPMKKTPIWTAFVSHEVRERGWFVRTAPKTIVLSKIRAMFVFCDAYRPLKGRTGEVELRFTEKDDAADFVDVVRKLRAP